MILRRGREKEQEEEKRVWREKFEETRGDRDSRSLIEAFDRIIAYWGKGVRFHS